MKNVVLLVDDEQNVLAALKRALVDEPYELLTAGSGEEGLAALARDEIKVVVSDERMPGMGGAEFLARVREHYPETVRIMLTGHADVEATMKAVNRGEIYRFFTKPWSEVEIRLALRSALEKFDLEEENRRLLRTVKRQSAELKVLSARYPGIADLERDEQGSILIEVDDEELAAIIERCNVEYRGC